MEDSSLRGQHVISVALPQDAPGAGSMQRLCESATLPVIGAWAIWVARRDCQILYWYLDHGTFHLGLDVPKQVEQPRVAPLCSNEIVVEIDCES